MTTSDIAISDDVDETTAKAIVDGLNRFNALQNGPDPAKALWVVSRDDQGDISGALHGHTMWDWFTISMLWVRDDHRGRGLGSRLLAEAEAAARQRGCVRCLLSTMTFQAPEFYRRFGYSEIGRVTDYPPGHSYLWMTKTLAA